MSVTPPLPPAFTIRTARLEDAQQIAETHVASWAQAYRGILPGGVLVRQTVEQRRAQWSSMIPALRLHPDRQTLLVGVDAAGTVRGFIHGGVERTAGTAWDAEVYAIYLHPAAQGHGLGARLLGHLAEWLAGSGHRNVRLWMLEGNPAAAFYARLGGTLQAETQPIYFDGQPYRHLSYGWDDLAALSARLPR